MGEDIYLVYATLSTMLLHHCMMAGFHGIVSLRWIKSYVATFVMS
jgi:hypothetical protein